MAATCDETANEGKLRAAEVTGDRLLQTHGDPGVCAVEQRTEWEL